MKLAVRCLTRAELLTDFPIDELVPGWFFRVREISNNAWQADGSDQWGRKVSCQGNDYQSVLDECAQQAGVINVQLQG